MGAKSAIQDAICNACNSVFKLTANQRVRVKKYLPVFCSKKCASRFKRIGIVVRVPGLSLDEERFWSKVDKSGDCWEWTALKSPWGYGIFYWNKRSGRAHRYSYEIHKGIIPKGLLILHACDNPSCVNPAHLSTGTHADNNQDCINKGRRKLHKDLTRCKKGHELSGHNLLPDAKNRSRCRKCNYEYQAKWNAKNRIAKQLK